MINEKRYEKLFNKYWNVLEFWDCEDSREEWNDFLYSEFKEYKSINESEYNNLKKY